MPRSVELLFDLLNKNSKTKYFTVTVSFLQIYKEKIFDLLNKSTKLDGPGLKMKVNKNVEVENLFSFECKSAAEVMHLFHFGIKNRVTASHNMNNQSSRSHSMLTVTLNSVDVKNPEAAVVSTLQLVDLAGSERQS